MMYVLALLMIVQQALGFGGFTGSIRRMLCPTFVETGAGHNYGSLTAVKTGVGINHGQANTNVHYLPPQQGRRLRRLQQIACTPGFTQAGAGNNYGDLTAVNIGTGYNGANAQSNISVHDYIGATAPGAQLAGLPNFCGNVVGIGANNNFGNLNGVNIGVGVNGGQANQNLYQYIGRRRMDTIRRMQQSLCNLPANRVGLGANLNAQGAVANTVGHGVALNLATGQANTDLYYQQLPTYPQQGF